MAHARGVILPCRVKGRRQADDEIIPHLWRNHSGLIWTECLDKFHSDFNELRGSLKTCACPMATIWKP